MQLLLEQGFCGMTPHDGSIVGGLYFMMVGVMQLVFEAGNLRMALVRPANSTLGILAIFEKEVPPMGIYCYYSLIALELVCILMAGLLLVSTWTHRFLGILTFATWLISFDLALVAITALLQVELGKVGLKLDPLAWCGVACRIITDPFWLAFVITHGLKLRAENTQHKEGHKRRTIKEGVPNVVKFKGFDSGI